MPERHSALDPTALSHEWKEREASTAQVESLAAFSSDRMLSQVMHEVKNTLGVLLMGADYLQKKLPTGESNSSRVLADMRNAISRTDAILRGLVELSAADQIDTAAADLHALIEDSLIQLVAEFSEKRLNVIRKFAAGVPPLLLDKTKLQKAITHLLRNALEAMPPGGTLTVQTLSVPSGSEPGSLDEPTVHIVIRDTGRGIEERFLRRVFDPFFTTDKTGRKTGLGLTVARKIILSHHGNISVANCPSGGAQVSVAVGGHRAAPASETPFAGQSQESASPSTTHPQTRTAP